MNVTERRYLVRNRRAASDLAQSVHRLVEARRNLDRLPASDALRQFLDAPTAVDAGRLLRERPGEIAKALGVESIPQLTLSLVASAVLGPVAGGLMLAGTSGLEGYANGLIGALAEEGVDVSDPEELTVALEDKELIDRVRGKATTEGAIQLGTSIAAVIGGGGRGGRLSGATEPKRRKGGHHWIPKSVWDKADLSRDARRVFKNHTSGPYGEPHLWSAPHAEYNHGVQALWDKNKYILSTMTEKEAWDFIKQVDRSRDPRIRSFKKMILDKRWEYEARSNAKPKRK